VEVRDRHLELQPGAAVLTHASAVHVTVEPLWDPDGPRDAPGRTSRWSPTAGVVPLLRRDGDRIGTGAKVQA